MIKALIFDMDGVLLDTENICEKSTNKMFKKEYGIDMPEGFYLRTVGLRKSDCYDIYSELGDLRSLDEFFRLSEKFFYEETKISQVVFSGVDEKLKELNKNFSLALATSTQGDKFDISTKHFNIGLFDVVINGNDVSRGKPDPECFLKAINLLNLTPDQCIIIEDGIIGIKAAKASGARCIALQTTFPKKELIDAGADLVIPNISNLKIEMIKIVGEQKCVE